MLGEFLTKFKEEIKKKWKIAAFILAGFLSLSFLTVGGSWGYVRAYENKVYPGVYVGAYHLGGMTTKEVKALVEGFNNRLLREGLDLSAMDKNYEIKKIEIASFISSDNVSPAIVLDSEDLSARALLAGREGNWWQKLIAPWKIRFLSSGHLSAKPIVDRSSFFDLLDNYLLPLGDSPHDARIKITQFYPLAYELVPEKPGRVFNNQKVLDKLTDNLSQLSFEPAVVQPEQFLPQITTADIEQLAPGLAQVLSYGDLSLNYVDPQTKARRDWVINPGEYAQWLSGKRDENGGLYFGLNEEEVAKYLDTLRQWVDQEPLDAKFVIEESKVKEFQASRNGLSLDAGATYRALEEAFVSRNYHPAEAVKTVSLLVQTVEPRIKLSQVNDLGLADIIGAGYSTFRDSHTNRIKNIANAVKRLNGSLIKPGEEFSALKYAGPFTAENGFLPEEVIKGNQIKKEIGGGMCQIGTTLFRMAMNSGMPITARRNHSLVVGYYADPVNGNPGTDATLYEPILDFKFLNDTGNYLLLQTEIDYKKQQLTFTVWGKSDGRKGWYSHPLVSRWIPAGEPQNIEVDTLKPGETKCQNAFRGAVASFTYSRVTAMGEKIDRVFDSYYRPLPKICLVGKAIVTEPSSTPAIGEPLPLELN